MSIKYVEGDLFEAIDLDPERPIVIPHVCNNAGGWGSGFVVPLGRYAPFSEKAYRAWHAQANPFPIPQVVEVYVQDEDDLYDLHHGMVPFEIGKTQIVKISPVICVANMIAQTAPRTVHPLRYESLVQCMRQVRHSIVDEIYFNGKKPHIMAPMFGSGLAGGNWHFIERLINEIWIESGIDVTIHFLREHLPVNWNPPRPTK